MVAYISNYCKYPVRDYLSVEMNIIPNIRHSVGMPPYYSDAYLRHAIEYSFIFSTERYIPTECFRNL